MSADNGRNEASVRGASSGSTVPLSDRDQTRNVALFTTSVQVVHLLQIAAEMKLEEAVRSAFARILIGSIGPVTSEELRGHGMPPDFEPSHPKMGVLVNEAAQRSGELLRQKRDRASRTPV